MAERRPHRRLAGVVGTVVTGWAIAGGILLLAVVAMTVASVLGGALLATPFPGDFELVQMGVAIAVFAFLPYCQLSGANVTADIFTMRASPRAIALMSLGGALTALAFALVLTWRMWAGMFDYMRYEETTTILQIPHWLAFVPILASLALLAVASLVTLLDAADDVRPGARGRRP